MSTPLAFTAVERQRIEDTGARLYSGLTTSWSRPCSRRRFAARRFWGPMVVSGFFTASRPALSTPKRVHADPASSDSPAATETARDFVTAANALPTPPAAMKYSEAFISVPGLPSCSASRGSGSVSYTHLTLPTNREV